MKKEKVEDKKIKSVPEGKKKVVEDIIDKVKKNKTLLIVSTKGLPSSQFQAMKKSLRGKAEIVVAKKSLTLRAISSVEKGALQGIKEMITSDVALMFSNIDLYKFNKKLLFLSCYFNILIKIKYLWCFAAKLFSIKNIYILILSFFKYF